MGKQRSRQLQDGRGTSNYQYKKEGGAVGVQSQVEPIKFLSEHSTESLEEGLKLLELDKKDIQAELRKRKKTTQA